MTEEFAFISMKVNKKTKLNPIKNNLAMKLRRRELEKYNKSITQFIIKY